MDSLDGLVDALGGLSLKKEGQPTKPVLTKSVPSLKKNKAMDPVPVPSTAIHETHESNTYSEYLRKTIKRAIQANDQEILAVVNDIKAGRTSKACTEIQEKIQNFMKEKMTEEEAGAYTHDRILDEILTNPLVRAHFRKDPTRQTLHETTQISWLRKHLSPDVAKLPANKGGITFINGDLKKVADKRDAKETKTLDIHAPSQNMYGVLKHTSTDGGAQDNQYRDVKHFISQMVKYLEKHPDASENFAFYLDGPYYKDSRRAELQSMIPEAYKEKIIITSCESLRPAPMPPATPSASAE
jgi:hypothetical protein